MKSQPHSAALPGNGFSAAMATSRPCPTVRDRNVGCVGTVTTAALVGGGGTPAGSAGFAAAAPQAKVAAHEFRALSHEIFNEPEQAEVFGALREWLQALGPADAPPGLGR